MECIRILSSPIEDLVIVKLFPFLFFVFSCFSKLLPDDSPESVFLKSKVFTVLVTTSPDDVFDSKESTELLSSIPDPELLKEDSST